MTKILLILSLTLGLASPVFAFPTADTATILEKGRIVDKRLVTFKNANGKDMQYLRVIVAYNKFVYDCWIYTEGKKGVGCIWLPDDGVN